jgi:hypothetical protein
MAIVSADTSPQSAIGHCPARTRRLDRRGSADAYGMIFSPSASSAIKGNFFSSKAISASEIAKLAGSIGTASGGIGAAAEAKLAAQACRAAAPPSRTPRKTAGAARRRASPSLASSPRSDQCAAYRELNSAKKNGKTKNANMLKLCRRAVPALTHALGRTRTTDHRFGGRRRSSGVTPSANPSRPP